MKRLLIVTTVECTLQSFLLPYAAHFRHQGWTVDALAKGATSSQVCTESFDHCYEADWSRNPLRPQGLFRMPSILRDRVEAGHYDLVHVHTPVAAFITRYALRAFRKRGYPKVVYTAHGFHFHDGRSAFVNAVFATLERLAGPWTDRLVVINHADAQEAVRRRIVEPSRLRYMPGIGLDLSYYHSGSIREEDVASVRAEMGLEPGQPLFLMVAEFNPRKRHRDLLAAFALLDHPEAHLAFAGQGPLMAELMAWCRKRGLENRVHFLGHRRDIPVLIRASLATVLPSEQEGLPRSVMESMALEVPVIGADSRGLRDLIDECGGEKVPVGDVSALKAAMLRMIQDPARARALGEQARARMEPFHITHLLKMHEDLYAELLDEHKG
jgi:glycosyltransferase involved in cell wall biosynthesis